MIQQYFNGELVWVLSQGEFIGIIIAAAILVVAFILFLVLMAPVLGFLPARMSKDKYAVFVMDKTHHVRIHPAKMKGNIVEVPAMKNSLFIKNDDSGSYTMGAVKCDFIAVSNPNVENSEFAATKNMLEKLGIESEEEACEILTKYLAEKQGFEFPEGVSIERLAELPSEADLKILIPRFSFVRLTNYGRWLLNTPEELRSWVSTEVEIEKRRLLSRDGSKKSGSLPIMLLIGGAVLAIILVMALMKNGAM